MRKEQYFNYILCFVNSMFKIMSKVEQLIIISENYCKGPREKEVITVQGCQQPIKSQIPYK